MKYSNAYWCVFFAALCNFFIKDGFIAAVVFMAAAIIIIEIADKNISVTINNHPVIKDKEG